MFKIKVSERERERERERESRNLKGYLIDETFFTNRESIRYIRIFYIMQIESIDV